jgi:hypothetical protein
MSEREGYSQEVQRFLDEEPDAQLTERARVDAERFREALARYASSLPVPGRELDAAVMSVVGARPLGGVRGLVRWLFRPRPVLLRPVLIAAGLVATTALGWWLGQQGGSPPVPGALIAEAPTVLVRFELRAPEAVQVALSGSFTGWDSEGVALSKNAQTGVWSVTVPLPLGEHEYSFVIDGQRWIPDPKAHAQVDDGFGQTNSVIVVGPRGVVRS